MIEYKSDVGCKRKLNEDYCGFYKSNSYGVYVVADGMGGHNAGEIASRMAVLKVIETVREYIESMGAEVLEFAIEKTNEEIYNYSIRESELKGMGTTITSILEFKDEIIVANVGDSSCFGIIDNKLIKLTKDHSLVQQLIDNGSISEEQAKKHPNRNIITRALGTSIAVDVDTFKFNKNEYEKFLLCSDGLTNEVSEDVIKEVIKQNIENPCEELVELAKENGGRDNITVMLFGGER